jgi:hypothetical protein
MVNKSVYLKLFFVLPVLTSMNCPLTNFIVYQKTGLEWRRLLLKMIRIVANPSPDGIATRMQCLLVTKFMVIYKKR